MTVDFYKPCVLSKKKKLGFAKICHPPIIGKLELFHSDVLVPLQML